MIANPFAHPSPRDSVFSRGVARIRYYFSGLPAQSLGAGGNRDAEVSAASLCRTMLAATRRMTDNGLFETTVSLFPIDGASGRNPSGPDSGAGWAATSSSGCEGMLVETVRIAAPFRDDIGCAVSTIAGAVGDAPGKFPDNCGGSGAKTGGGGDITAPIEAACIVAAPFRDEVGCGDSDTADDDEGASLDGTENCGGSGAKTGAGEDIKAPNRPG
jgi:hypothetical protein